MVNSMEQESFDNKNSKKWVTNTTLMLLFMLLFVVAVNIFIDPYFHYHAPVNEISYRIYDQRYQNDGILKHFDYDAIIIGTSMTENFQTSQMKNEMGYDAVKVPFSGARYKELNENTLTALRTHDVKCIFRCLDVIHLAEDKDAVYYAVEYPTYLYDNSKLDDLHYLLNRDVFTKGTIGDVIYTLEGGKTTTFDEYCTNDTGDNVYDDKARIVEYDSTRSEKASEDKRYTEDDKKMVQDNLEQNVISTVRDNPNVTFDFYFPPYSIMWWDQENQNGRIDYDIKVLQETAKELLQYDNVHLYAFSDNTDMVCDLSRYKDMLHYGGSISRYIMNSIAENKGELTKENYRKYLSNIRNFYSSYDYEAVFGSKYDK